ncbi:MAG TPA: DUF1292 domain-containing protein [Nitrosomonas sp.]|nr:hypothetical protein [Nitrosomonas sp.]HNP26771.1 DUF1292 domain-containing protein [Nitrosomonas sp.]
MSKHALLLIVFMLAGIPPVLAMSNEDDPRILISYMDKALTPELDILRVTAQALPDSLVFQIKTRGERTGGESGDYLLLHITHGKSYTLLVPVNKAEQDKILMYEGAAIQSAHNTLSEPIKLSRKLDPQTGFSAQRIHHGVEFSVPLDWIDFGNDFGYDAYTAQVEIQDHAIQINELYDQAGKGRKEKKQYSAITLINKLCATRRMTTN